ncbi:hypothetical protein K438DRAFT_1965267 [Mycena galopus ATCC 62051]|nr:hypothetical protein K438DRAFT_1965267 [Mycena galopus ATCC 62051]
MGGDLTMKIVCFGETPAGNDFEACCVDFDKNLVQRFQEFLRLCFSNQDIAKWAFPGMEDIASDERTVERVVAPVTPPEMEKPVKKPSKSKKSKQSKLKSKAQEENKDASAEERPEDTSIGDVHLGSGSEETSDDAVSDNVEPLGSGTFHLNVHTGR